jgi:site-specific DNA-methyltransferase (adenine-specific)
VTQPKAKQISGHDEKRIRQIPNESLDVVILNSHFDVHTKESLPVGTYALTPNSRFLLDECIRILKTGGLLFVYGLPKDLPFWGEYLDKSRPDSGRMIFKYWIALDIDARERSETLCPSHMGLLFYLKSASAKSQPAFHLNTKAVKVPHQFCAACGLNVKDWGGKKHLMHPDGTALADVWRDISRIKLKNHQIPCNVENRVVALTDFEGAKFLKVLQSEAGVKDIGHLRHVDDEENRNSADDWKTLHEIKVDDVYCGDSIGFLQKVTAIHPEGLFDMVFADPPYNLSKGYNSYDDALGDQHYIDWCNRWLYWMAKTLKPGGSLFVLNLPKWAIHHATFLDSYLEFRHWIVWDALSDPRGKLMPAHYALLYYTKPGGKPVFNYRVKSNRDNGRVEEGVLPADSPKYCLRASCVKRRKLLGNDEKSELSDIWFDIHRIKHKRDRDAHPCQLPERLMERLIELTTNRGGIVFDPFCGAGTTAIASVKRGRRFVVVDMDKHYVEITKRKISAMRNNADLFGHFIVPRETVRRVKKEISKKGIETYLQDLARRLRKEPTEMDIQDDRPEMLANIDVIYPTRMDAIKRCRVVLNT